MTNPTNAPEGANSPSLSLDPITWASTHPDAELLTAWREYVRVFGVYNALPPMSVAEIAPWDVLLNTLSERVETIPARTMEGMHVKLRYLLESTEEKHLVGRVVICGDPVTEEFLNRVNRDFRPRMLWRMIQDTKPGSFPAPGPVKGVSSIDTPDDPDAALLAAFRTYQSFICDGDADSDSRPAEAARKVMDNTPARTLAGVLALLGHYLGDGDLGVVEMVPVLDTLKATIDLVPPEVRDVVEEVVEKAEELADEHFRATVGQWEAIAERDQLKASLAKFRGVQSLQMVMLTEALGQAWDAVDEAERQECMARRSGKVPEKQWAKEMHGEALRRVRALESAVIHLPGDTMGVAAIKLTVAEPGLGNIVERLEDLAREDRGWSSGARDARDCLSALRSALPTLIRLLGIDLRKIGLRAYTWPDHWLDTEDGKAPISTAA